MSRRPQKKVILCDGEENTDPSKRCVAGSRPRSGMYYCRYCGRVLEQQFEDDAKDVESFGGKNDRRNVTIVRVGRDTSDMLLRGNQNDKQTNEVRTQFAGIFARMEAGDEAIENAMQYYEIYLKLKMKANEGDVDKFKKVKTENLVKGISMIVFEDRGIPAPKPKVEKNLDWKFTEVVKLKNNIRKLLNLTPAPKPTDYDGDIRSKCMKLGIGQYSTQCIDIEEEMFRILEGKHPTTIIACIINFIIQINNLNVNENDFQTHCSTSTETIKKIFRKELDRNDTDLYKRIRSFIKN